MSPPPPRPETQPHRRRTDTLSGWTPAHDDDSADATTWRARKALEVARRAEARDAAHDVALAKLTSATEGLAARFDDGAAALDRWLARAARVAWGLGIPLTVLALGGVGALIWRFVSTLHH